MENTRSLVLAHHLSLSCLPLSHTHSLSLNHLKPEEIPVLRASQVVHAFIIQSEIMSQMVSRIGRR